MQKIEILSEDALNQIKKNKYQKELQAHQVNNRIEMAMVFVGKSVYLANQ